MNRIRVDRLLLAGFITFLVFVGVEIVVEYLLGYLLLGSFIDELRQPFEAPATWGAMDQLINITIALLNSTLLIWLYAALRPMFGVGPRTAIFAGAVLYIFLLGLVVNFINLGFFPARMAFPEMVYELIELPIAIIIGAQFYEREL